MQTQSTDSSEDREPFVEVVPIGRYGQYPKLLGSGTVKNVYRGFDLEEEWITVPVALAIFAYECFKLYKESKKRNSTGNPESVCEATIDWIATHLMCCAFCRILEETSAIDTSG
ncbi:hypothetical protein Tco_0984897 [Tanacetum coccineum]